MNISHLRAGARWLAVMLLIAADARAGEPVPTIPHLAADIRLDGRLEEDAWRAALRIDDAAFTARWMAGSDPMVPPPFTLRLFHDGRNLYVALACYDRFVEGAAAPEDADGLYAFSVLDAQGRARHYRLRFAQRGGTAAGEMLTVGWGARVRGPYNEPGSEGGGYVIEFAIPLQDIGASPGDALSLNAIVQNHDGNPGGALNAPATRFGRFAWGTLNNDDTNGYRRIRLAPASGASSTSRIPPEPASGNR